MGTGRLTPSPTVPRSGFVETVRELLLWALGRRKRLRVVNQSMMPTICPGDFLLVDPNAYRTSSPVPGELVIACHPEEGETTIAKRIASVGEQGVELLSDNPTCGQDSRHFGALSPTLLRGRVTCVIR